METSVRLNRLLIISTWCIGLMVQPACRAVKSIQESSHMEAASQVVPSSAADSDNSASIIRELEERVRRDAADFVASNKLAGYYLQRLRETGDVKYLELTGRAIQASIKILPEEQNPGALLALAQFEFASHNFVAARAHALRLNSIEPGKTEGYQILADALLELGDYNGAADVFQQLAKKSDQSIGGYTRLSRFDLLRGQHQRAQQLLNRALSMALEEVPVPRETIAWCRWQLGELEFAQGDYNQAEQYYRESLTSLPNYYRSLASLGRVLAARGDLAGAIAQYEQVTKQLPDPSFVAALGDLYKLSGREKEAASQYALVEQIAKLNAVNGTLYNRQLALFFADHDLKTDLAFELASKEYDVRRDVYGADALAWTALKAGKLVNAQAAIKEALRLGTMDAKLFYHAGMIARAAGDREAAHDYLKQAIELSPNFDPLQAAFAQRAVAE